MTVLAGVDFGTSNSAIGIVCPENSHPRLVPVEGSADIIPTAVFYKSPYNEPVFGREAVQTYVAGEEGRLMRSIKRALGTDIMTRPFKLNGRWMNFERVLERFLSHLKNKAEQDCGKTVEKAVLGRPVKFCEDDAFGDMAAQKQLENAAKVAGFKDILFQYEPIAAAFAHEGYMEKECLALVLDIGGGTSDFTAIRLHKNSITKVDRTDDILGNSGVRIGGTDFDKHFSLACFAKHIGMGSTYGEKNLTVPILHFADLSEWSRVNSLYSYKEIGFAEGVLKKCHNPENYVRLLEIMQKEHGHRYLGLVEEAKIELSEQEAVSIGMEFVSGNPEAMASINNFNDSIKGNLSAIEKSIEECLEISGIKAGDVGAVILTGGSTAVPAVVALARGLFPMAEMLQENRMASVAVGLTYDALRRF